MHISSRQKPKPNLIYTVIFDAPGSESYRFLGKMLVSSLLRTFFSGEILVFRNSPTPLFLVQRKGLDEIFLETPEMYGQSRAEFAWCWKYRVAELIDTSRYDKIMFLDADTLALRNVDHLLEGDWDVRYQPERVRSADAKCFNAFFTDSELVLAANRAGINSGTLAIKADIFYEVMAKWQEIDESETLRDSGSRDQASWNALLLRNDLSQSAGDKPYWRAQSFPDSEIQFPGFIDPDYNCYTKAALTHNIFSNTKDKIEFTFGLYMRTFFCDPSGLFLSFLEM